MKQGRAAFSTPEAAFQYSAPGMAMCWDSNAGAPRTSGLANLTSSNGHEHTHTRKTGWELEGGMAKVPWGGSADLRSSPTCRISHSILVSSMALRPKGHSCLSSRLLFSRTICRMGER